MQILLDLLETHHELVPGQGRYTKGVRKELLTMSPATIDRYLRPRLLYASWIAYRSRTVC